MLRIVKYFYVLLIGDRIILKSVLLSRIYVYAVVGALVFLSLSGIFWNIRHCLGNIWVCHHRDFVISVFVGIFRICAIIPVAHGVC